MTGITQDIVKNILSTYFDKNQIKEFKGIVVRSNKSSKRDESKATKSDKRQLDSNPHRKAYPLYIDLLITFATDKLNNYKLIELMLYLGETCIAHGELEIASQIYTRILSKANNEGQLKNIAAYSLLALGDINSRQAKWDKSISFINQAKKHFNRQNDLKGIAKCNNMLGTIYGDRGNIQKAKECFENSLSILNPQRDIALIGMIETNIGILNNIKGDYDGSLLYYQRALIKYEQLKDALRMSQLRHNLGMLHTQKKEYESALREFDRSITISIKAGFLPNLALSYLSKAYVYAKSDDLPLASAFADKSFELSRKLNDRLSIADIYKIKGIIERKLKHYKISENYFLTSLRLNTELENILNQAETLFELGELYIEIDKKEEAKRCLKTALKNYKKIGADIHIKEVKERLDDIL
ncbi:MAG: tetratricopeptide repeat protein [Ignavibacteriaceae bacterium]|nr:tetratricopeptide repeat protein [Ignavibacteriaceae bacterium]